MEILYGQVCAEDGRRYYAKEVMQWIPPTEGNEEG